MMGGPTSTKKNVFRMRRDPQRERAQCKPVSLQPRSHGAAPFWPAAAGRDRWAQGARAAICAAPKPDTGRADAEEGLADAGRKVAR